MICLKCEGERFENREVTVEQEFKGKSFNVVTQACVCMECGFFQFDDQQADALCKITVDAYKKAQGLLRGDEIRVYRKELKMSQRLFADYLGVGVASVKRWETHFVQDKSQDDLIRIKCDPSFAWNNALEVRWAHQRPDKYNGFRKFDINVCKNVLSRIIEVAPSPLFFFKAIFYVDFLHFKRFKQGITGMQYSCFERGPIPKDYDHLISYFLNKKILVKKGQHDLASNTQFDKEVFSADELGTLNYIYSLVEQKGKEYLLSKSHDEEAFKKCGYLEVLNYEDAKYLKLE